LELNKVFELESRIQMLREQLQDADLKLALSTDRNAALTQQIIVLSNDLQALKGIRDAQASEGEMLQHQLLQYQGTMKALELQLSQFSLSDQHLVRVAALWSACCAIRIITIDFMSCLLRPANCRSCSRRRRRWRS